MPRDWSRKKLVFKNTETAIWWFRGAYLWAARTDVRHSVPPSSVEQILQPFRGTGVLEGLPQGIEYRTLENFYLTMRMSPEHRERAASTHKHASLRYMLKKGEMQEHESWELFRDALMWRALCEKHRLRSREELEEQGLPDYRLLLMDTAPVIEQIVEGNTGCENYWGVCVCPLCTTICERTGQPNFKGKNVYGKMLLSLRAALLEGRA